MSAQSTLPFIAKKFSYVPYYPNAVSTEASMILFVYRIFDCEATERLKRFHDDL